MVFSFQVIHDNLPQLLWAARLTFMVSVLGVGIGLALGALVCAARLSPLKPVRVASAVYISFSGACRFWFSFCCFIICCP